MSIPDKLVQIGTLQGSIEKWEKIVDGSGVDNGRQNCPCCQVYYDVENRDSSEYNCVGCPIFEYTGQPYCVGTPYDDWDYKLRKSKTVKRSDTEGIELATKELNFLRIVLDKLLASPHEQNKNNIH